MRVALLCPPSLTVFEQQVIETLLTEGSIDVSACGIDTRPSPGPRAKLRRNLRQGRGGYVLVMALKMLVSRVRRSAEPSVPTEELMRKLGLTTVEIDDPTDPAQIEPLVALEPDALVLIGGFGIVKEPLLSLAPHGVLSYHHGDMRHYRGMPPAFWELYNDEVEMGVTVQRLSAGIDEGVPLVERRFPIGRGDTLAVLERRIFDGSTDMLHEALRQVAEGATPARLESYGDVYTLPNLRQWLRFQLKMARRGLRR